MFQWRIRGGGGDRDDRPPPRDIFIKSPRGGGHLRFWTFSKTNFGPFLTKDAKLWTLRCVIQRSRNFTKHSKLWTFFYAAWLRGSAFKKKYKILDLFLKGVVWTSRYLTKHPKLWTFLVSHWVRGPDILQKIQSCGPSLWRMAQRSTIFHKASKIVDLSFRHVAQRYRYLDPK